MPEGAIPHSDCRDTGAERAATRGGVDRLAPPRPAPDGCLPPCTELEPRDMPGLGRDLPLV